MPDAIADQTSSTTDLSQDPSFTGSLSYSADAPEPNEPKPEAQAKPEEKTEKPAAKLPSSITPPKPTGKITERISELVQTRDRFKSEAQEWREKYEALARGQQQPKPESNKPKSGGLNPEDFETYGEYIQALIDQRWESKAKEAHAAQQTDAQTRYRAEKRQEFSQHAETLAQQYEGFWDAISDPSLPITEPMADAVMELGPMAPYVMLYLASNKEKALAMARQSPVSAALSIGKLASALEAELQQGGESAAPQTNALSAAPRPTPIPSPRGTMPANELNGEPSDRDDTRTWFAKETARLRRLNPNARFYGA